MSAELETELVGRARTRARLGLIGHDEIIAIGLAAGFVAAAVAELVALPALRPFNPLAALAALLALALVSRVEFEVGNGLVNAAELVLVPMLFVLPPRSIPLIVAAGLLAKRVPALMRREISPSHVPVYLVNATYALGPAAVIALTGDATPRWDHVPVYVGALAAQFGVEFAVSSSWSRFVWKVPLVEHARAMRVSQLVDASLAPVGLAVAIASGGTIWGIVAVLPLVGLLKVFARERQMRIDHALELSSAYRGTALLLGDVIEADDAYTGSHSREVVDLVVAVSHRLHLDPAKRRRAEFAALLHDVGKVKIPSEIINKPGPLTHEERAIINTHTIIGEKMLSTVGGLLGDIGHVVRSSHERWDGGGYPDGLAGEEIPLEARIVCACDAWSAMTNDRSYRRALPPAEAADELQRCSGTQFDPAVVDALFDVLDVDFA